MSPISRTILKIGSFGVVMVLLTVALFASFGQYRSGSGDTSSAVVRDASSLRSGDSVRVAGVRIGTVKDVRRRGFGVTHQPESRCVRSAHVPSTTPNCPLRIRLAVPHCGQRTFKEAIRSANRPDVPSGTCPTIIVPAR